MTNIELIWSIAQIIAMITLLIFTIKYLILRRQLSKNIDAMCDNIMVMENNIIIHLNRYKNGKLPKEMLETMIAGEIYSAQYKINMRFKYGVESETRTLASVDVEDSGGDNDESNSLP